MSKISVKEGANFSDLIESVEPLVAPRPFIMHGRTLSKEEKVEIDATQNYEHLQGYLNAASSFGIDARYAWGEPGGNGKGVLVVDIEKGWNLDHEDLPKNIQVIGNDPSMARG